MQLWLGLIPAHAVVAGIIGHWILFPLVQRSGVLTLPARFTLTDILCLMVLLQVVLAGFFPLYSDDWSMWVWLPFLIMALFCVICMWGASVCVASNAGIMRPSQRAAVILVLIPGTLVVINAIPLAIGAASGWFAGQIQQLLQLPKSIPDPFAAIYGIAVIPLLATTLLLHYLAAWVLKSSDPLRSASDNIGPSLPQGFVEQDGGGDGEIEAIDAAEQRQADRDNIFRPPKIP
jgi:hypothetical protein